MKATKQIQQQLNMKEFFKYIGGYFADLGMLVLAFLAPIHVILWTIISVVVIDTITGIMKAGKEDVKNIKSRKAATIVSKLIFYVSGVIIAQIFQNTIDPDIPFVKLIASAIILIEVKSIDENMK
jgi:phage-related holin